MALNSDKWGEGVVVNTVMKHSVSQNRGNFLNR